MKDRILDYLAQGLKPVQVSSIIGCSASYISQLLIQPEFKEALRERRKTAVEEADLDKALTNKYTAVEHSLLNAMETQMAIAELPALARALEVIGNRQEKRLQRLAAPAQSSNNSQVIVNITLPSHAIPEYQINAQKEVISVDNKVISPLSSDGVKRLFASLQDKRLAAESIILPSESITAGAEF